MAWLFKSAPGIEPRSTRQHRPSSPVLSSSSTTRLTSLSSSSSFSDVITTDEHDDEGRRSGGAGDGVEVADPESSSLPALKDRTRDVLGVVEAQQTL